MSGEKLKVSGGTSIGSSSQKGSSINFDDGVTGSDLTEFERDILDAVVASLYALRSQGARLQALALEKKYGTSSVVVGDVVTDTTKLRTVG